jgi:hypothetical protein
MSVHLCHTHAMTQNRHSLPDASTMLYAYGLGLVLAMNVLASAFLSLAAGLDFSLAIWASIVANAGGYLAVAIGGREMVLRGGRIAMPSTPVPARTRRLVPGASPFDAWVTADGTVYFGRSNDVLAS